MKLQRDKIKQYQRKIQAVLDREHEIAIECLRAGKKEKARLALRRRKYQEQMLEKADKQLETLEQLVRFPPPPEKKRWKKKTKKKVLFRYGIY